MESFLRVAITLVLIFDGIACVVLLAHYHLVRHHLTARRVLLFFTGILSVVLTLALWTHCRYLLPAIWWASILAAAIVFRSIAMWMFVLHMVAMIDNRDDK